jgi:hypothetical protein
MILKPLMHLHMLISFDIGTKNLALCVLDGRTIKLWQVLDLVTQQIPPCTTDGCLRRIKFSQNENVYCKTCAKSKPEFHTLLAYTRGNIRSKKLAELRDVLSIHHIDPPHIKQQCIIRCQQLLDEMKVLPLIEKKAEKPKLPAIGLRLMTGLDACLADGGISHSHITAAVIENQVGPIASTMKAVQGMVTQYCIMRDITDVEYVSAVNKLKPFTTKKLTYKQRKKLAVDTTAGLLETEGTPEFQAVFETSKKKDDLADSYLQGLWIVQKREA